MKQEKLANLVARLDDNRNKLDRHIAIAQDPNSSRDAVIEANKQISELWTEYFAMHSDATELGLDTVADLTSTVTLRPLH